MGTITLLVLLLEIHKMEVRTLHRDKTNENSTLADKLGKIISIIAVLYAFLLSLDVLTASIISVGQPFAEEVILATANPFVGLFIGLLTTAILQSSSTTTSILVALVSASTLPMASAIPIVMGANVGTTVTSTIVALGHITKKREFRKAIAGAVLHDFFNIVAVLVLFPLEYFTGFLSNLSTAVSTLLLDNEWQIASYFSFLALPIKPISNLIMDLGSGLPLLLAFVSLVTLFLCVKGLTILIRTLVIGKNRQQLESTLFDNPRRSLASGFLLTTAVQSSSLTTSLIVPFVATGKISLRKSFPYIMGANVGTTITALIAAISKSDAAIALAMAHLLFNVFGVLLLYPLPFVRSIPVFVAKKLGQATVANRLYFFLYFLLLFFIIPFLLILSSK